jgi:hypothetical protein
MFAQQQADAQRQMLAETQATRAEATARAEAKAAAARQYAEGRNALIEKSRTAINDAYSGFDDNYFNGFANDFVNYYKPKLATEADNANRTATFSYANTGGLRSSAAARSFGDLTRQKAEKEGQVANAGIDAAGEFRNDLDTQKSDALSLLFSSGAVGADSLPDGGDAGAALAGIGSQLGALTQTQVNKAKNIKTPSFTANNLDLSMNTRLPGQRAA